MKTIIIKKAEKLIEIPLGNNIYIDREWNIVKKSKSYYKIMRDKDKTMFYEGDKSVKLEDYKSYKNVIQLDEDGKIYSIKNKVNVSIGQENCDIQIRNINIINICISEIQNYNGEKIYFNGKITTKKLLEYKIGDEIFINNVKIRMLKNQIEIWGKQEDYTSILPEHDRERKKFEGYPIYKKSPRIVKHVDNAIVKLSKPPDKAEIKKGQLVKIVIPPLIMIGTTVLLGVINPRGIYMLISVIGAISTLVFSVTSYLSSKNENRLKNQLIEKKYTEYLLKKRKELYRLRNKQIESNSYHYPAQNKIVELVVNYDSRIYERNLIDGDFLTLSIGKTDQPSEYKIDLDREEIVLKEDELQRKARELKEEFSVIERLEVIVDLKKAHLGIVGEKINIHEQLKNYISQITFHQSYHDVQLVFIYSDEYKEKFEYLRWYPHFKISAINIQGLVNSESMRDQVLGSLFRILKDRKLKNEEKQREEVYIPHYVFIIDEPKLIINHIIMEILQIRELKLNYSVIYTSQLIENLPENIRTIVFLKDSKEAEIILKEGIPVNMKIKLEKSAEMLEKSSRILAGIKHEKGMVSQIPESVSFFELYGIKSIKDLDIIGRWNKNVGYKSLSVPLGLRGKGDVVELNLHEKSHGPHGLIAGTTGSGKSEIVQSYVLSLSVNFHPHEVGFLLIDYKGGGMASLFKKLPHLLGVITNLDGSESARAMASIKSELTRRQHEFNKCGVNNISDYSKLYKLNQACEPMPHLFIISDEFAELKKNQSEFMDELISAARIGRSLGIHLILATQKPSGVVDDQIWSNTKFRLALKVADEADSKDIIKTSDAANITQPGRAYLQVGNNEIYELFQSAYSGSIFYEDEEDIKTDDRIYLINELGQGDLLNDDLSGEDVEDSIKATELDVVVEEISEVYKIMNTKEVKKPWLPSLESQIVSPHIVEKNITDTVDYKILDLKVPIGIVDIPEQQLQCEYIIDFLKDGNLEIYGSSGYGKSSTIITIILTLAIRNSPKLFEMYVLDFGNAALSPLKMLPQVADYFKFDDIEKINKLIDKLNKIIVERKILFGNMGVTSLSLYNRKAIKKISAIMVIIDNYDVVTELDYEIESFFTKLSRDGVSLGINMIITGTKDGAIKYAMSNNFKNKLSHYIYEESDITSIIGKSSYKLKPIPGRAMVKQGYVSQMQTYSSVKYSNDIEYSENIIDICEKISKNYSGEKLKGIKMLPEVVTLDLINKGDNQKVSLGLTAKEVKNGYIYLDGVPKLIIGTVESGKTNILKLILTNIEDSVKKYVFDGESGELHVISNKISRCKYYDFDDPIDKFIVELDDLCQQREADYKLIKAKDKSITPRGFYTSLETIIILVDDLEQFVSKMKSCEISNTEDIIIKSIKVGVTYFATTLPNQLRGYEDILEIFKKTTSAIILGNPESQNIISVPYFNRKKYSIDTGFIYSKGSLEEIRIPKII